MLVVNGYIREKVVTGGGMDSDGYPIPPSVTYSEPIEAQIRVVKFNNRGFSNGEQYTQASYEILVKHLSLDVTDIKVGNTSVSEDRDFKVLSIEHLPLVGLTKIIV